MQELTWFPFPLLVDEGTSRHDVDAFNVRLLEYGLTEGDTDDDRRPDDDDGDEHLTDHPVSSLL